MPHKIIDNSINQEIGNKLRRVRQRSQYSQQNVADDIKLSSTAYSKMENGKTDFSVSRLKQLADYFHVYLPDFFDPEIITPRDIDNVTSVHQYEKRLIEVEAQKKILKDIVDNRIKD